MASNPGDCLGTGQRSRSQAQQVKILDTREPEMFYRIPGECVNRPPKLWRYH